MIILDTSIIFEMLKTQSAQKLVDWLDAQIAETLYLSIFTVAELRAAVSVMPEGEKKQQFDQAVEEQIIPLFTNRVLPFNLAASQAYAQIVSILQANGSAMAMADMLIAATAKALRFQVATLNAEAFMAAEVKVINPLE